MMRIKPVHFPTIAVLALIGANAASAQPKTSGATFDVASSMSTPAMGGMGGTVNIAYKGWATSSGSSRMEIVSIEGVSPTQAVGDYMLTIDGHIYMVHPGSKTYVDIGEQTTGMMNNMPPEMLAQMTVTDVTGSSEKLGSADVIDGRPAEHTRVTVGYSINMMGQAIPSTIVSDYWFVKFPVHFQNPTAGVPKLGAAMGPMEALVKKQMELAPSMTDGVAVKTVVTTTVVGMGQSLVTTISSEMKNLKPGDVDASVMKLPEGYTKADK